MRSRNKKSAGTRVKARRSYRRKAFTSPAQRRLGWDPRKTLFWAWSRSIERWQLWWR